MLSTLIIIIIIYCIIIAWLTYGFTRVNLFECVSLLPQNKFTIVVPFRNEANTLPLLLDSISKLDYPIELFEVILVDDESEEPFVVSVFAYSIQIVQNNRESSSPKKDAITTAMELVKSDWIITTDADCVVPQNWLLILDNYIQNHEVSMIAGAVTYDCKNTFLQQFQKLDLASLQGATIGSFGIGKGFICNGANFAYTKTLFKALNGFNGNESIASGDDVFLLQKAMRQFPERVHYLKSQSNIVTTKPLEKWKSLFYQRVRWASKTTSYESTFGKLLGLVVLGGNLCWILGLLFCVLGEISWFEFNLLSALKFLVDFVLLFKSNRFLSSNRMRFVIFSSFLYPFFSVIVALYSLFGKYEWKGRKF